MKHAVRVSEVAPGTRAVNEGMLVSGRRWFIASFFHFTAEERREYARQLKARSVCLRLQLFNGSPALKTVKVRGNGDVEIIFGEFVFDGRQKRRRLHPRRSRPYPQTERLYAVRRQ